MPSVLTRTLVTARALISDPRWWLQGKTVMVESTGTCFCSSGALGYTNPTASIISSAISLLNLAAFNMSHQVCNNFIVYNDNHTHSEVMSMWDHAIQASKRLPYKSQTERNHVHDFHSFQ